MKYSEMDSRQKKAFANIKYATLNLIGDLENTMMDYEEDTKEFEYADNLLSNRDKLKEEIYNMAISGVYREGFEGFGPQYESTIKDIKFCGKEFLMEVIEHRLGVEGY